MTPNRPKPLRVPEADGCDQVATNRPRPAGVVVVVVVVSLCAMWGDIGAMGFNIITQGLIGKHPLHYGKTP